LYFPVIILQSLFSICILLKKELVKVTSDSESIWAKQRFSGAKNEAACNSDGFAIV